MIVRWQVNCVRFARLVLLAALTGLTTVEQVNADDGQRFVEVGQLAEVRANSPGKSKFVLLDEAGVVIASLRPAAGVDLRTHLGEEVGVTARTILESDTPVLLAESVTTFGAARQISQTNPQDHVALASHDADIVSAAPLLPSPMPMDGASISLNEYPVMDYPATQTPLAIDPYYPNTFVDQGCGIPGCTSCGGGCGSTACETCAACPCGLPGRYWIRAESLIWWTKGMNTPALLVSSPAGTPQRDAGVLGVDGNQVLYGGEVFDDSRSGTRFRIGKWHDRCNWIGLEADFFFLNSADADYRDCTIGNQIIGRPFTNSAAGPDAELIDFPGVVAGTVHIDAETSLWSISPRLRVNLSCERFPDCLPTDPCGMGGYRFDLLVGYRYLKLEDDLSFSEQLMAATEQASRIPRFDNVTYIDLRDSFATSNEFHGADIGFAWEGYRGPWSLELMGRVGIGNTHHEVAIRGATTSSANGNSVTDSGGLLALDTNIGTYSRDEFGFLPEVNATLGYSISPRMRLLVGYTFLYWNNVARAGDQIDTTINTDFLPDVQATTGPNRPAFSFVDTSYWAQGLSLGLDYRW